MRKSVLFLAVLFAIPTVTQTPPQPPAGVSEKDFEFIVGVMSRLDRNHYRMPQFHWTIVHTNIANSSSDPRARIVFVYDSMPRFLDYSQDEMAFIIGHEIGHIQDRNCGPWADNNARKSAIAPNWTRKMDQQTCEARADEIGLQYLIGAGFDPLASSAVFGRLTMWQGDTGVNGFLDRFTKDHPISTSRIANLRRLLIQLCPNQWNPCR